MRQVCSITLVSDFDGFVLSYSITNKLDSQILLVSTSSSVLHRRGSEKAFNEYPGVGNAILSIMRLYNQSISLNTNSMTNI